ncbi:MAG: 3-isopropylmalate dehydratase small subunit [Gammaproteobacteria bacterium]
MKKFEKITSIAAPLDRANVDTDAIIPKQFLKSIHRSGFGPNLFDEWRYLDHGEPGMDNSKRPLNMDFVLNQEHCGCGSSREHAPWALLDHGFEIIIAPSFADIFYNNCFKNGILPIALSDSEVNALFNYSGEITVDLESQSVSTSEGTYQFDVDSERKRRLLNGLDDIGLTLQHADKIKAFERDHFNAHPWL